jgi:hypothetical protein
MISAITALILMRSKIFLPKIFRDKALKNKNVILIKQYNLPAILKNKSRKMTFKGLKLTILSYPPRKTQM